MIVCTGKDLVWRHSYGDGRLPLCLQVLDSLILRRHALRPSVRILVMLTVGLLTLVGAAGPVSAAASSASVRPSAVACKIGGPVQTVEEELCGGPTAKGELTANCKYGHFKFWSHDHTSYVKNSNNNTYCPYDWSNTVSLNWSGNTCVEFYWLDSGVWYQWGGIACAYTP